SLDAASLSPTELPFTRTDFDPQMQDALDLMPEIVGDESVGVKYAVNGLLSLTPDGMPILGETPEGKGLWAAAAVWVREGRAAGKGRAGGGGAVARRRVGGGGGGAGRETGARGAPGGPPFHAHQQTRRHVWARTG